MARVSRRDTLAADRGATEQQARLSEGASKRSAEQTSQQRGEAAEQANRTLNRVYMASALGTHAPADSP